MKRLLIVLISLGLAFSFQGQSLALTNPWEDDDSRVDGSVDTMDTVDTFINTLSKDIHERILSADGETVQIQTDWTAVGKTCADLGTVEDVDLSFEGATADDYETAVIITDPTADRTLTVPDANSITLPSGACFYMISGSCPAGTTDITATYSNKFIKINATQATTSGTVLTGASASHTLSVSETPAHAHPYFKGLVQSHYGGGDGSRINQGTTDDTGSIGGDSGHNHDLSGATTLEPASVTMKLCQVD